MSERPLVGVGVLVMKDGQLLLGKRKNAHGAGEYASPGGHLEQYESFEACARREVREETGLELGAITFLRLLNTTQYAPRHYVDVSLVAEWKSGEPRVLEPEKVERWDWYALDALPRPLFGMLETSVEALRTGQRFFDEPSSRQVSATEVFTTRVLKAPRERVFKAFTDPSLLTRWWGPKGFTSTFEVHEPREGGAWRFVLHGPDGRDYKNHGVFAELVPPRRLVFDHQSGPVYRATFELEALGEATRLSWHMRFDNPKFLAEHGALIVTANGENLDRLEAVLASAQ